MGLKHFQSLEIDDEFLSVQNKKRFEADLFKSINAAIGKSQEMAAGKMKDMTGLNIPGL